jgi:hypothetical protein
MDISQPFQYGDIYSQCPTFCNIIQSAIFASARNQHLWILPILRENRGLFNFRANYDEMRGIDPDTLADELRSAPDYVPIPEYAFDCHTRRGKAMGKTKADFFKAEQAALMPLEQGLFDHLVAG